MPRILLTVALFLCLTTSLSAVTSPTSPSLPTLSYDFPTAAHNDATIEWWYVNAHMTTASHRHLAIVASFFRFGNGTSPIDNMTPMPRSHYLIYAITDLDKKSQQSYSFADSNFVNALKLYAPFMAALNPNDKAANALEDALTKGQLPKPHQKMIGTASITDLPFQIDFGGNTVKSVPGGGQVYQFILNAGGLDRINLTMTFNKPTMAVGGNGETGLKTPTDMHYFSLTRGSIRGGVNTGKGMDQVFDGQCWFDHQWGTSWVTQNNGWDWFGVQLKDGTDILFWRQRDLATGKVFFPLATVMDKDGHQFVTKNIVFIPDPKSNWTSPTTGVTYPLRWDVDLPEMQLNLKIAADPIAQEIPILGPGGSIWEGHCSVVATKPIPSAKPYTPPFVERSASMPPLYKAIQPGVISGVAYMELVGYNSPAVKAQLLSPPKKSVKSRKR
jgi:predicted secreted hydrolase